MRVKIVVAQVVFPPKHLDDFVRDCAVGAKEYIGCELAEIIKITFSLIQFPLIHLYRKKTCQLVAPEQKGRVAFKKSEKRRSRISGFFHNL